MRNLFSLLSMTRFIPPFLPGDVRGNGIDWNGMTVESYSWSKNNKYFQTTENSAQFLCEKEMGFRVN